MRATKRAQKNTAPLPLQLEVDLEARSHGTLQVQSTNVLPVLFQQGRQKVGGQDDVDFDLFSGVANVRDGNVQAQNFLHLELDGGTKFVNLALECFAGTDDRREFTGTIQAWAQKTRDLLDQGRGGKEAIVLSGQFFHQLLVLFHLGQISFSHSVDAFSLGTLAILLGTQQAVLEARFWDSWELEGTSETFVLGRVISFQRNLQFNSLHEVTFLAFDFPILDGPGTKFVLGGGVRQRRGAVVVDSTTLGVGVSDFFPLGEGQQVLDGTGEKVTV